MNSLFRNAAMAAVALAASLVSTQASAQYQFQNNFSSAPGCAGADTWVAQFANAGGFYNEGDVSGVCSLWDYTVNPAAGSPAADGGYLNMYLRYDDPGILYTGFFRNLGGFAGDDPFSGNNGQHTLTACVYVPEVADFGADFASGVDAGLGVRYSGLFYGSWPGDGALNESLSVASFPRGVWTRASLTFTLTDAARVDAGVWASTPDVSPRPSSGVLYDDMWLGLASDAPTTPCFGAAPPPVAGPVSGPSPTAVPILPVWALIALAGIVGLFGSSRLKKRG